MIALVVLAAAAPADAAPAVQAVSSTNADSASLSVSHTVAGSDRLLTVCVGFDDTSTSVSNVTFGGVGLTKVTQVLHSGGKPRVELWRLVNPAVSTANVAVTLSSAKKTTVGVISFTGVDQTTPIDGATTASGTTNTATVNVTSASGDLVVDCMGTIANPSATPTVGSNQTSRWTREQGGSIRGAGSTEAGAASVTMSWGLAESKEWATIGFNVNEKLCGNGVLNGGESCDDGANNGTTASCCTTTCTYKTAGTACGSSGDTVCDNPDTCNGTGTCLPNYEPNTTVCRADAGACDVAETCNGAGTCPADAFEPIGTSCGDATDTTCDNPDTCNGAGACLTNYEPSTTVCREDAGACDIAETCDGAGACPDDAFEAAGTSCGDATDTACDNPDTCNGAGTCLTNYEPNTTVCRADAGACDVAETCDGAGACPDDAFEAAGTSCGDATDTTCDNPDTCDGAGACLTNYEPNTTVCREDAGACDVAESCDGAGACPADAFESAGTSCGDTSDGECDDPDTCDGTGACLANHAASGVTCGDPGDSQCDHPDTCDGGGSCSPNHEAEGAACGDGSSTTCDQPDSCDGSGACQVNHEPDTTVCRSAVGECDVAETCDGAGACPADGFESAGTACGDPADSICDDPDTCDGSGACAANHAPDTLECRADAGPCDIAETCDGAGSCPADGYEPEGTACGNPSNTICDNPDSCDAAGNCLVNNEPDTTPCRADAGECDVAEFCDGAGACPTDAFESAGTACGDPSDSACDHADTCDGNGSCLDNLEPGTTVCRAAAGECDVAETCDGAGACPADALATAGTACGDPSDSVCDHADTCDGNGSCLDNLEPAATVCRAAAGDCDVEETCDGNGACPADALATAGTACGDPTDGECDNPDTCDDGGACLPNYEPAAAACGDPGDSACDNPDSCDGGGACTANGEPDGTSCNDGAFCNGADSCVAGACTGHSGDPCAGADGDGNCAESCDEATDSCSANDADGSACDDGDVCSTGEQCSGGSCTGGSVTDCDDGDLCTADSCDPEEGCVHHGEPLDASLCVAPGKFSFAVKDAGDPAKNTLQWKWNKGEPVDPAELGSPTSTTGYALCVYDHTAGVAELVGSYVVPPGSTLWSTKPGQLKYADKPGTSDGITSLKGKASLDPSKSQMGVKAKGSFLAIPDAFSANEYFDMDPRLTVQLRNDEGTCWTSQLTPANVKKNTGVLFKATGP